MSQASDCSIALHTKQSTNTVCAVTMIDSQSESSTSDSCGLWQFTDCANVILLLKQGDVFRLVHSVMPPEINFFHDLRI